MAVVEQIYSYQAPSQCLPSESGYRLLLAASGLAANRRRFEGSLRRARQTALAILCVARVARTRFDGSAEAPTGFSWTADPLVSADIDQLVFEAFSPCGGVHARLDLISSVVMGTFFEAGTASVDLGLPVRAALGRVGDNDSLLLSVGAPDLALATPTAAAVERRLQLPMSWIAASAQARATRSRCLPRHQLSSFETRRFLRSLPSPSSRSASLWMAPAGGELRLSRQRTPIARLAGGIERLGVLGELSGYARGLRLYSPEAADHGATGWELELEGARLSLVLSADPRGGFSAPHRLRDRYPARTYAWWDLATRLAPAG